VPGNGGVNNPELQSQTVQEGQLHGVVAKLLPQRIDAFIRNRNRILSVQVSTYWLLLLFKFG